VRRRHLLARRRHLLRTALARRLDLGRQLGVLRLEQLDGARLLGDAGEMQGRCRGDAGEM